ncbi:MAG TPA: C45 family peptidase [Ramlibacter sp.]|nr:C45 family peptidase [Ramlibacter sp.]
MTPTPFPLIEISGPPEARGKQYGQKAADRIHKGASHYTEQLRKLSLDKSRLGALINDYLPVMENFDPAHVAEMRGIAVGAEIAFEDVVLLNARTELLKLASSPELRQRLSGEIADGCTGLVVQPEASADGKIIHAQNWDWKFECAETAVVLRIRRTDGPDILTFTEAGGLARSGMNNAGISLTANFLESDLDYQRLGVPLPLIRRKILEQQHLALAMHAAYVTQKSGSCNMMLSHKDGMALNFECAPSETFLLHAENGLLVHANHWVSSAALSKLKDRGVATTPDTLYRDMRVKEILRPHIGRIEVTHVKAALLDDFASPWAVCRPPRMNLANNLSATVASIVMRPTEAVMQVACLPAVDPNFVDYGFDA